jgi:XapX domain-containing protein
MRLYLVSLGAGLLVGVIYSLLNVRSPAPPLVALVGLLGIPVGKQLLAGMSPAVACRDAKCVPHLFGELPDRHRPADAVAGDPLMSPSDAAPELILYGGRITALDRANPLAETVAIIGGRFSGSAATPTSCSRRVHERAKLEGSQLARPRG